MIKDFKKIAVTAALAADAKQAENLRLLNVRKLSGLTDFLLLATIDSSAQLDAVEFAVEKALKELGLRPTRRDGAASALWRVLDYGGLLVHVMHRETRAHYGLDKLYDEARLVDWAAAPAPKKRRTAARKR